MSKGGYLTDRRPARDRYACRIEKNGTWTVFDAFTGHPAELLCRQTVGMQGGDAEEMAKVLNRLHPANDSGTVH